MAPISAASFLKSGNKGGVEYCTFNFAILIFSEWKMRLPKTAGPKTIVNSKNMITRAQLNAALRDLEERLRKDTDLRLEARFAEFRQEMEGQFIKPEEQPELQEEDLRLLEESIARLREDCRRNAEEIRALRAELEDLEQILNTLSGYFAAAEFEEDDEIRDDFGS